MRSVLLAALALPACYAPPDLPVAPYETPILGQDSDSLIQVCAPEVQVRVGCVVDGDTLDVNGCGDEAWRRVRLLGIDAPETEKPGTPADCGADAAFLELRRITSGRTITLGFDAECTDVYGRTLGYVWMDVDDALDVLSRDWVEETLRIQRDELGTDAQVMLNAYLLARGYARRFDESWVEPLRHEQTMIFAERYASTRGLGVWSTCE